MIVMGIFGGLLILQPDLGSTVVLLLLLLGCIYCWCKIWAIYCLRNLGILLIVWLAVSSAYRLKRVTGVLSILLKILTVLVSISNSLIAFGRGEFFGEGLGNSIQKLGNLPEAHTDFVMAVIGEEFGFIGIVSLLYC